MTGHWRLPLQPTPVPPAQIRCGVVGGLEELKQQFVGTVRRAHRIVWQKKFFQVRAVVGCVGLYPGLGETGRFRIAVSIKRRLHYRTTSGPPAGADALVRIGLAHCPVRQIGDSARMSRRGPAAEPGAGQIEGTPEEVDGAALSDEPAPELLQHSA